MGISISYDNILDGIEKYLGENGLNQVRAKVAKIGDLIRTGQVTEIAPVFYSLIPDLGGAIQQIAIDLESLSGNDVEGKEKMDALIGWLDNQISLPFILDKVLNVDGKGLRAILNGIIHTCKEYKIFPVK